MCHCISEQLMVTKTGEAVGDKKLYHCLKSHKTVPPIRTGAGETGTLTDNPRQDILIRIKGFQKLFTGKIL